MELPLSGGRIGLHELRTAIADLPDPTPTPPGLPRPSMSVVLCTRERPQALETAISSLLQLDYPDFEIVIVDNASRTDASRETVARIADPRVRLVSEPKPGLARARNLGVREATKEIVAFTDDDVVVDRHWLSGLADGFAAADDVACVCGMVPTGELRSYPQAYFDSRVVWAAELPAEDLPDEPNRRRIRCCSRSRSASTAPARTSRMRRATIIEVGGFDEALGVGIADPRRRGRRHVRAQSARRSCARRRAVRAGLASAPGRHGIAEGADERLRTRDGGVVGQADGESSDRAA